MEQMLLFEEMPDNRLGNAALDILVGSSEDEDGQRLNCGSMKGKAGNL